MIIEISFSLEIESPPGLEESYKLYLTKYPEAFELNIDLIVNVSPGDPGRYSGKWEDCYPEEPTTFEPDPDSYKEARRKITIRLNTFHAWLTFEWREEIFKEWREDNIDNLDKFINSDEFDELSDEA
ncbi:MAG TPA: hypothetical protein ENI76_05845, partial [Ignavibacteria bacterium]|nr:hypothetical protein [Ignavibacteria bacterium]